MLKKSNLRYANRYVFIILAIFLGCGVLNTSQTSVAKVLNEEDFHNPPRKAGVRCWWWWLNGNVTKEAITKDLEAMHEKGFSGAMIFDAGGANQGGNAQVPAGPMFASPEWTELYMHALKEAKRLGLEMGLSIQSGWNLGGPNVTPDFAAKQLTWSEVQVKGRTLYNQQLPVPNHRNRYYRDICVLAYPTKENPDPKYDFSTSSHQDNYPPEKAIDGNNETFWVSAGTEPSQDSGGNISEWIQFSFKEPISITGFHIQGRPGYGPKECRLISLDEKEQTKSFTLKDGFNKVVFDSIQGTHFRILFEDAYDPVHPDSPRNVQVANVIPLDAQGRGLHKGTSRRPIKDLRLKSGYEEIGMSAPDTRFLLNDYPSVSGEEDVLLQDILDITNKMNSGGLLKWDIPEGTWTILRFGYTITNSHVSTYSGKWKGHVIDYLSKDAFDRYWIEVVDPLLQEAGPLVGTVLKELETDSWECGGMNWSPEFPKEYKEYCGYDPIPYLPVIAGKIVQNRQVSNAFLADLRKTLAHCVSENHYRVFAEHAARYGIGIQPESAGPHAGPMDGIKNYSHSDIMMSEFWVPSPHRPTPSQRFFVKQASSAAHIYGKQYVGAESFTSIGPHWNDVLWKSQKPSMDHEFCSGLNMIFFHTYTCSPKEMGLPGQEYFAGTHINPQVTWWDYSDPFMNYINRIQTIVQMGKFVADVLYYYGDHVPNIFPLKESDPAGVLPGYDYDVINEDILLRLKVSDGKIMVPGGISYYLLVLPDHKVLSLAALEKVEELLHQGAMVLGSKPERLVSLVGGESAQPRFHELADQLWGTDPSQGGQKNIGKGRLFREQTARNVLQSEMIPPDFEAIGAGKGTSYDYIHYTIEDIDVYFVCNQAESSQAIDCVFRVIGKQPELWNPITGQIRPAVTFQQSGGRTTVPLVFDPYGSLFVIFRESSPVMQPVIKGRNFPVFKKVSEVQGPWQVAFDPAWGGPESIQFEKLTDWSQHTESGIRYYSGEAVYTNEFLFSQIDVNKRYWLQLNNVEDVGIAAIELNGKEIGITWTNPFRLEITEALKSGQNQMKITVVNSWRNRLVGDRGKPQDQRYTKTNITIRNDWKLLKSGLLGPVEIVSD